MRIGVDLGGTKTESIAIDDTGTERARLRVPTPNDSYDAIVACIVRLVRETEACVRQTGTVGIGIPGAVSPATGLVKNANTVALIGHPLDCDLERALGRPVRIANDANCFVLSEASDGAGASARVVFGVIVGTGTGGGVVVDGKLLTGPHAIAANGDTIPCPGLATTSSRARLATAERTAASKPSSLAPPWRATIGCTPAKRAMRTTSPGALKPATRLPWRA